MSKVFNTINSGNGGFYPLIIVTSETGSTITCTKGSTTLTATESSGTWTFKIPSYGTWTINGTSSSGKTATKTVSVTKVEQYSITLSFYTLYAFHVNGDKSSPSEMITYPSGCENENYASAYMNYSTGAFNYGDWEDAFFMPKPCMLKYDGTVDYYLNPNDYTKKEDGTASDVANTSYGGNAMMEWGQNGDKIYYKIVPDSGSTKSATVYICNQKLDSDYKGYSFINNQGDEVDHFYTPIYNGSLISSKIRSLSGQSCMNNQSGTNEITYAKANNTGSDVLWYTEVLADVTLINLLLWLIGKSTNMQTVYGNGHYTGGSSASSLLTTGSMNSKGLFYGTNGTGSGVKVFGMENWWGNQWRRYAGHINASGTQKVKFTYGTEDGSTATAYNTDGSGYKTISATPSGTSGGYISEMMFTSDGMFPKTASGSDSTYYCDGLWFTNSKTCYAYRSSSCADGLLVGGVGCAMTATVSHADWGVGVSLSCKPLV